MPKIPTIHAQGPAGILQLPRPQPRHFGAEGFAGLTQMGAILGELAKQRDEREILRLDAEWDVAADEAKLRHAQVADPEEFGALVTRDIRQSQTSLLKGTTGAVQRVLTERFGLKLRRQGVEVGAEVVQRRIQQEAAGLLETLDSIARQAAGVPSAAARAEVVAGANDLITRAEGRRIITPDVARQLRERFPSQAAEVQALQDIRLDATGTLADLKRGAYAALAPEKREELIRAAEAREATERRRSEEQTKLLRDRANVEFYRKLRTDTLSMEEVLASPHLSREDQHFFFGALTKREEPRTDPRTALVIEDLLDAPTATREEAMQNAERAKRLIQQGYAQGNTIAKEDALNMIRRANDRIAGKDPETDRWFKLSKDFLKDKFGWQGGVVGRFLKPEGAAKYWELVSQLMQEQEASRLTGKAIYDRAIELAGPAAVGFWADEATRPDLPAEAQLPDPAPFRGRTVRDNETGKFYRSDGTRWLPVEGK